MRELFLVPYIYFRNAFYIIKLSNSVISGSWLLIQWILYGPFFLCYNVFVDLHHYIQVLSDLKLDSGKEEEIEMEALK